MKQENKQITIYIPFIELFGKLSPRGIRVLCYVLEEIRPDRDKFYFINSECLQYTGYKSKATVYNGLNELLSAGFIIKGNTETVYYINPLILFKGKRDKILKKYMNTNLNTDNNAVI